MIASPCQDAKDILKFAWSDIRSNAVAAILESQDGQVGECLRHLDFPCILSRHNVPTFKNIATKVGIFFHTATHLPTFLRHFNTFMPEDRAIQVAVGLCGQSVAAVCPLVVAR